jgi:N-methylhydantoinase B/oxoprolinase/acetone carboxylase alpha subunit
MPGETIEMHTAGGAGYGPVSERDAALVDRDLELGYVTRDGGNS